MNETGFANLRKLHVEEEARKKRAVRRIHTEFHKLWLSQLSATTTIAEQVEFVRRAKDEAPEVLTCALFQSWACRPDVRMYFNVLALQ